MRPGERFAQAAVREAKEELGVSILAEDVVVRALMHRPNKQRGESVNGREYYRY